MKNGYSSRLMIPIGCIMLIFMFIKPHATHAIQYQHLDSFDTTKAISKDSSPIRLSKIPISDLSHFDGCFPNEELSYLVGSYYYPWYFYDFHGGQYLREHLIPSQEPTLGEYNDRDYYVIKQHLDWGRYAGIDFWVTSWWGPGSREDVTILNHLLTHPELGNIKIALFYETVGRTSDFTDYSHLGTDITYISENYFDHPNYLRIDGKPVLFIYLTRVLSYQGTLQSSLNTIRTAASNAGYELFIIGDQVFGYPPAYPGDISLLDGVTNYDVYGSMGVNNYAGQTAVDNYYAAQAGWKTLANNVNVAFIPAVTPGFNDRGVRDGHVPLSRKLTAVDEFGSLFTTMIRGAKALVDCDIDNMIMVTSWNEWHEDTQIEPVLLSPATSLDDSETGNELTNGLSYEGYGEKYLDILRDVISEPLLVLHGLPGDQTVKLSWTANTLPPGTNFWQIAYEGPQGDQHSPITNIPIETTDYTLTGLANYNTYTLTLNAMIDNSPVMTDTVIVMPTDILVYLPLALGTE